MPNQDLIGKRLDGEDLTLLRRMVYVPLTAHPDAVDVTGYFLSDRGSHYLDGVFCYKGRYKALHWASSRELRSDGIVPIDIWLLFKQLLSDGFTFEEVCDSWNLSQQL